jgi:cobalt-zinc-cadmium efflux system membrane fusion protein
MKKIFFWGCLVSATWACQRSTEPTTDEAAQGEWQAPQLLLQEEVIHCSGVVEVPPQYRATVSAPLGGYVREIRHYVGDSVRKGDILCALEHPDLIQLQDQWLESKARLAFLQADAERKESLARQDATSSRTLEMAQSEYREELARFQSLGATLRMAGISEETLDRQGIVNQVFIRSPISGFITDIPINVGKYAAPNDVLYSIIDPSHLHLELNVFPADAARVKPGMRLTFELPGVAGVQGGYIKLVGKDVHATRKAVVVHAHADREDLPGMRPGSFVDVSIPLQTDSAYVLPVEALMRQAGRSYLLRQSGEGMDTLWVDEPLVVNGQLVVPYRDGLFRVPAAEGHSH